MLEKNFDFKTAEADVVKRSKEIIAATAVKNRKSRTFTITLPPPNVTGSLHLGHAFTSTLQDVLLRYHRQHGDVTLGQPGLDHAGIATQIIVANQLSDQGVNWQEIGRETFIKKVWEWKEKSGGCIVHQLIRMGMSIDLDRLRFTMDEKSSRAVLHAFTQLYNDGLIFRAKRIVNWDPALKTAVSDLEVTNRQEKGTLWYIHYPLEGDEHQFLTVATTRPETLFGDQAVAVHPDDERYRQWVGRNVRLPLTRRIIPVIADEYSDPEKGSGVVKITPAHDFNDFEVGQRHSLEVLSVMDESARLNEWVPAEFRGLSVMEARKKVLAALEQQGFLEKAEAIQHAVPYNDRSGSVIEPRVTDQWFLDVKKLAPRAIQAVKDGEVQFVPDAWKHTYFDWLENVQPWCLSRQIWWGHQIPVWHTANGKMFCAMNEDEAIAQAAEYFGVDRDRVPALTRDPDVLDTWFSSSLWPFSTLGWPEATADLRTYFPTDVLVTGFDIIFFWVSRMIMMSLYFTNSVPFRKVYINPLVRDEKGQKMSKSKGNVIDPLFLADEYGVDALRFTLTQMAIPGRDIRVGASSVEIGRNFMTKIWNAAKFLERNQCLELREEEKTGGELSFALNRWIVAQAVAFKKKAKQDLEDMRFDFFAQGLYRFMKEIYCDVYIEGMKAGLANASPNMAAEIRGVARGVFLEFLKVAHPVIPFITETLWTQFGCSGMLLTEPWCEGPLEAADPAEKEDFYISVTEEVRSLRGLVGLSATEKLHLVAAVPDSFLGENREWFAALARLDSVECVKALPKNLSGLYFAKGSCEFCLKYPQELDLQKAKEVFAKKIQERENEVQRLKAKLSNEAYKKAKPEEWAKDAAAFEQKKEELQRMEAVRL